MRRPLSTEIGGLPDVRCTGKGRKERATALTKKTASVLRRLLAEHDGTPDSPLFANTHGSGPLSRSAVSKLVARHAHSNAILNQHRDS